MAKDNEFDATKPKAGSTGDAEVTPKTAKTEMVQMPREDFERMNKDIELLKKSVSQSRLHEQRAKMDEDKEELPKGHLKKLRGKIVVRWYGVNEPGSKAKQEIIYQNASPVGERLIGHYVTLDGEEIVCDSLEFTRSTDLEHFTKVGEDGGDWVIAFNDVTLPQSYTISPKFINP